MTLLDLNLASTTPYRSKSAFVANNSMVLYMLLVQNALYSDKAVISSHIINYVELKSAVE